MRIRIQRLKNRRTFNVNQKICKLCGKEYLEKENFNWSCRTHRVTFNSVSFIFSLNMEVRCGGAAARPPRTPRDASTRSTSAKRMRMKMMEKVERTGRPLSSKSRRPTSGVYAAKRKDTWSRNVWETLISEHSKTWYKRKKESRNLNPLEKYSPVKFNVYLVVIRFSWNDK